MELEPIPQHVDIKPLFVERYKALLGKDYELFLNYSLSYQRKAIRVNTLKISIKELQKRLEPRWILKQVPWCKEGFWIEAKGDKRFDIGNLLEHVLGYIYVQDASSMIPPLVLDQRPGELILDVCAAPGSKSSQIAQYMHNEGLLVCNDVQGSRLKPLGVNLQRCGLHNHIITLMQPAQFPKAGVQFDRILVDAPCSGTGTIRKSLKTLQMWSPNLVSKMAKVQLHILRNAYKVLKPGGTLVYSTCTLEPEENEAVVSAFLAEHHDMRLQPIILEIKRSKPVLQFDKLTISPAVQDCLRIHPQDNDSEGFFVSKLHKSI
ncbi:MAG: RsmB/NOP family class I SAM-dependent RNA methyltransferase [archaeon]